MRQGARVSLPAASLSLSALLQGVFVRRSPSFVMFITTQAWGERGR